MLFLFYIFGKLFLQGYVLRIAGGNDKQGFPMKQGILTNVRVRLLLSKGHSCFRPRRTGERRRKSVRGCIVDSNLSVLAMVIVKKGYYKRQFSIDAHVQNWFILYFFFVRNCSNNDVHNSKPISLNNLMFPTRSELLHVV